MNDVLRATPSGTVDVPAGGIAPLGRLRRWVIAVGVALAVAVLAALSALLLHERLQALDDVAARQALLARVMAQGVARQLDSVAQALATLAGPASAGNVVNGLTALQAALAQTLIHLPQVRSLAAIDAEGHVLASSDPDDVGLQLPAALRDGLPAAGRQRLGDMLTVRRLADLAQPGTAVLPGLAALPLWHGLKTPRPDGAVALVALVNAETLAGLQQVALAAGDGPAGAPAAAAALLDLQGQLVVASDGIDAAIGSRHAGLPAFRSFLPRWDSGTWAGEGLREGTQHVAFRALAAAPLVVVVETGEDAALAAWRTDARGFIAAGLAVLLLIAGMTAVAQRSLRARAAAQQALVDAERTVARQAQELAVTVGSLQELIFRTDADGVLTYVNEHWARVVGPAPSTAVGRRLADLVAPADRERLRALFAVDDRPGALPSARTLQVSIHDAGGAWRCYALAAVPLQVDGRVVGHAGSALDVTERELAQQRLRAQLEFTERLLEISPLPIAVQDTDGRYRVVNPAWEAFTGVRRGDVCMVADERGGAALPEPLADAPEPEALRARTPRPGHAVRYEARVTHVDGTPRDVVVNKVLLPGRDGRPDGLLCVLVDVTEFRRAERAIREAHDLAEEAARVKAEFVSNITHELRTPLQSILGFSELARMLAIDRPKLGSMLDDIHGAGRRMLSLVDDLLDVARIEHGSSHYQLERTDLRALVREVVRELEPSLQHRGLRFVLELPERPLAAKVDPPRMQQVLRNVLGNAIKYSPAGGRIRLQAQANEAGEPVLVISDQGPGIPEGELEKIFDPFVQSSQTKDGSGGSGLGLAVCRKLVQAFGGVIQAANQPEGGAAFTIRLPARGAAETRPVELTRQ